MKYPLVQDRSVLVTGCSTGIGLATARVLRDAGWRVLATARKPDDLEMLKREGFDVLVLDVADSDSVQTAFAQAMVITGGTLGGLVNNAGFAQAGAIEDIDRDALRRQFETNVFGVHELTRLCLPVFQKAGVGRIVNVSSVLGRITLPLLGAYCASKYAMESLSDALRVEVQDAGIAVSLIEPGPIVSAFRRSAALRAEEAVALSQSRFQDYYEKEVERRRTQVKKPDLFTRPPEAVAVKVRHALESKRPRIRYPVTIPAYLGIFASRFLPARWIDRASARRLPT